MLFYFQSETKIDKFDDASELFKVLRDKKTKPMLMFLQYMLQIFNKMNTEFQSEHFRLYLLHSMVVSEYRNILSCFIKEELLHMFDVNDIDINQESNYKKSSDIYLGVKASAHLIKGPLDAETENRLKNNCLKFLVELCKQFKKRFSFNSDSLIAKLNVLKPNEFFTQNHSPLSVIPLAAHFPMLIHEGNLNDLDD